MLNKQLIFRYLFFAGILLLLNPLIASFFIKDGRLHSFQSIFQLQTTFLLFVVFIGLFVLLIRDRKFKFGRVSYIFITISLILFVLSFSTKGDFYKILNEGVEISDNEMVDKPGYINYESSTFLNIDFLTRTKRAYSSFVLGDERLKKEIYLDKIPEKEIIKFHTLWQDYPITKDDLKFVGVDDGKLGDDLEVFLEVNNRMFDITDSYSDFDEGRGYWVSVELPQGVLEKGENEIIFYVKNNTDLIRISSQETYTPRDSYKFSDGEWKLEMMDFVMFVPQKNSFLFSLMFKLSFVFKIIGVVLLFIGLFGVKFLKFSLKSKKEFLFVIVSSIILYYFYEFMNTSWQYLSKITTLMTYFLLKISFLSPTIDFSNSVAPSLGSFNFVVTIADVCSGMESLALFTFLFLVVLVVDWKKLNFKTLVPVYVIGLVGVFILNVLRIYFLILIGTFFSRTFALTMFHSTAAMVLFILYFIVFIYYSKRHIER